MTAPSDSSVASASQAQEARLLVALLRSSRVSLLFGEPEADKSAFLQSALLPLLQRRVGDQPAPAPARETGVVVPFPDRRQRGGAARRKREVVVLFDDWSGTPLTALQACLRQAAQPGDTAAPAAPARLIDNVHALGECFDIHFIILLDRFEEFLRLPPQREGVCEFTNELVEALNAPQLPANFLLSLNEDARPALAALRRRIPGFDDFSLKLPGVAPVKPTAVGAPPAVVTAAPTRQAVTAPGAAPAPTPPPIKAPRPLHAPVKTQDVYALIEATLNRTAADNDCEPFLGSEPGALAPVNDTPAPVAPRRRARKAATWTQADDIPAEPAAPPVDEIRCRAAPTLIERFKALLSRLRPPRRESE